VTKATQDDYEYIYVPTNFTEDKWIQAAEVLPGDRRVVHHATVSVIDKAEVAKLWNSTLRPTRARTNITTAPEKCYNLRSDAPVIDDGCAAPDGGGVPGESSGY